MASSVAIAAWNPTHDTTTVRSFVLHHLHNAIDREISCMATSWDQATAAYSFGLVLHETNELHAAKTHYDHAVEVFPHTSREYFCTSRQLALVNDKIAQPSSSDESTLTCLQGILEAQRERFGDNDSDTVDTMVALGYTYATHGQPTLAWHVFEKALHARAETVGVDHTSTLHVMELLAGQLLALHQYAPAAAMYARCLEHYDKSPTPTNTGARVTCASNLAAVRMCLGQYSQARTLWTECLEQDIITHGLDSDDTLVSMANVAEAHRCLGLSVLGMVYGNQGSKEASQCLEHVFLERKRRFVRDGTGWNAACKSLYQWYHYCRNHLRFESLSNIEAFELHLADLDCVSETWRNERCHACTQEIHGDLATCPQCVAATYQYCRDCAAKKAKRRCNHRANFMVQTPPMRELHEKRLQLLAMTDQHEAYDNWFDRYEAYCTDNHVPDRDRLMQPRDEHQVAAMCFACVPWI
ncbi:hypothetical protein DYB32_005674 [Aphanomyces invadans]|uniref:Uncharacterized protein n=1 Tax=Aphanomyces invadans TaxID=157072 RepID=A0A3R6Z321_9STRA|nr:hypothetical protein DYB32_005674 [Aphanomyces invadans]